MIKRHWVGHEKHVVYGYDALGRIDEVLSVGPAQQYKTNFESYTYDLRNNPVTVNEPGLNRTYSASPLFHQVPGWQQVGTGTEEWLTWDSGGRLSGTERKVQGVVTSTSSYLYDGQNRLVRATATGQGQTNYGYDVDDQLVAELRNTGLLLRQGATHWDGTTGQMTLSVWRGLRLQGGVAANGSYTFSPVLVLPEDDGHAVLTVNAAAQERSARLLGGTGRVVHEDAGAIGAPLAGPAQGWPLDGLHGSERDARNGLVHRGTRHYREVDGLWLQPEPLLVLGVPDGSLGTPRLLMGAYAAGNVNVWEDVSGYKPSLVKDLAQDRVRADETPWRMMGKGASTRWWVWCLANDVGVHFELLPNARCRRGKSPALRL